MWLFESLTNFSNSKAITLLVNDYSTILLISLMGLHPNGGYFEMHLFLIHVPGLEVWNRNFFAKVTRLLHENDQNYFIQSNLHCYLHIFPTSPESGKCHANKTVRLLNQTSYPAILVHFRMKWSVVQRERGPVMRTECNPTEPSLENKRHAPVFPQLNVSIVSLTRFAVCDGALSWCKMTLCCLLR